MSEPIPHVQAENRAAIAGKLKSISLKASAAEKVARLERGRAYLPRFHQHCLHSAHELLSGMRCAFNPEAHPLADVPLYGPPPEGLRDWPVAFLRVLLPPVDHALLHHRHERPWQPRRPLPVHDERRGHH